MYKISNISLKKSFSLLFGFQLILIIILAILIFILYQNQINLAKSRDTHFNSYLLADELRQSSDDLTRMARAYVATGNPEFERNYWTILDIRNGKIPRPINYERIYWDFVLATGKKPRLDSGDIISLHDLMVKEGFTDIEFEKLNFAQKNSDELVKTERIAMNAIKGLYDDGTGNFIVKKEPDFNMAFKLLNGQDYYKMKAEIMEPIDDFYQLFEERTGKVILRYLYISNILFLIAVILSVLITFLFWYSFVVVRRQIVEREKVENDLKDLHKNLEQKIKEKTKDLELAKNKMEKTLEETERLNDLMIGRELKMVELKDQLNKIKKNK